MSNIEIVTKFLESVNPADLIELTNILKESKARNSFKNFKEQIPEKFCIKNDDGVLLSDYYNPEDDIFKEVDLLWSDRTKLRGFVTDLIQPSGMNFKMVASEKIKKGEVVLLETPIIGFKGNISRMDSTDFDKILLKIAMDPERFQAIRLLSPYRNNSGQNKILLLSSVLYFNYFGHGEYKFLYFYTSFINHSCFPNCYASLNGDKMKIASHRDIEVGEEITISYVYSKSFEHNSTQSIEFEKEYMVACNCRKCFEPEGLLYPKLWSYKLLSNCILCGKSNCIYRCSKCKLTYCSKECQINDWKLVHKNLCALMNNL